MGFVRQLSLRTVGLLSVGLGTGCTLALSFDARPCETAADCMYSDGQGVCVNNVCSPGNGNDEGSDSGNQPTDDGSGDGPDDDGSSGDDGTGTAGESGDESGVEGCQKNSDCAMDQRCGDGGDCINLLSEQCHIVEWPADGERDNVVFIGSIMPTGGLFEHLVVPIQNAVLLGIEDFNAETALQADRKVAWVGCDDTAGEDAAVEAARHLVDNVGVPAIVGSILAEATLAIAEEVAIPAGVMVMSPGGGPREMLDLADDGLMWHALPDDVHLAHATADMLIELQAPRVLLLGQDAHQGRGILQTIETDIAGQVPAGSVTTMLYPGPTNFATEAAMLAAYGQTIAQAFEELPDVYENPGDHYTHIIFMGAGEAQALLYAYMNTWKLTQIPEEPSPELPTFYFGLASGPFMEPAVNQIGQISVTQGITQYRAQLLENIDGLAPVVFYDDNFNAFNIRYKIRFNEQDALTVTSLSYDSVMAVMFAMCTVPGDQEITGAAIAAAMPRLNDPQGTFVSFSGTNLSFITAARNALVVQDGTVDLLGVSGDLNWNEDGGVRANVLHWQLEDVGGDNPARLDEYRIYQLDPAPAEDGQWQDL